MPRLDRIRADGRGRRGVGALEAVRSGKIIPVAEFAVDSAGYIGGARAADYAASAAKQHNQHNLRMSLVA